MPRGADRALHAKLGRGGLSDVEWTVQLLQLQHAARGARAAHHPHRRGPGRRGTPACSAAEDAAQLAAAWRWPPGSATRSCWSAGGPGDTLPARHGELTAVARLLGYPPGDAAQALEQDYRRAARHARAVMERLFYD